MTKLRIKVSKDNAPFIIYNHLFVKEEPFTIDELQVELLEQYGLDVDKNFIKSEIKEYLNSGLVVYSLNKYKSCMKDQGVNQLNLVKAKLDGDIE